MGWVLCGCSFGVGCVLRSHQGALVWGSVGLLSSANALILGGRRSLLGCWNCGTGICAAALAAGLPTCCVLKFGRLLRPNRAGETVPRCGLAILCSSDKLVAGATGSLRLIFSACWILMSVCKIMFSGEMVSVSS